MENKNITIEDLAIMIQKGFNENTRQHQRIFEKLSGIDQKIEGIVYRHEFEKLEARVKDLEALLALPDKK